MTITETTVTHSNALGRVEVVSTRERFISMEQALDIHDPFINVGAKLGPLNLEAPRPAWTFACHSGR